MPTGNQSRSDDASRAAELRQSDIRIMCDLIGGADHLSMEMDRHQSRSFAGFRQLYSKSYDTLCEGQLETLTAVPNGSASDLVILAGHAALMADQIKDLDVAPAGYTSRLLAGIHAALVSISGSLAIQHPEEVQEVAALWPELARSIRGDAMTVSALRAEREGR